jgi:hypothetical protein
MSGYRCPRCQRAPLRSHAYGCPEADLEPVSREEAERLARELFTAKPTPDRLRGVLAIPRTKRHTDEAYDDLRARARAEHEEHMRAWATEEEREQWDALTFDVPGADEAHAERVLYGEDLA